MVKDEVYFSLFLFFSFGHSHGRAEMFRLVSVSYEGRMSQPARRRGEVNQGDMKQERVLRLYVELQGRRDQLCRPGQIGFAVAVYLRLYFVFYRNNCPYRRRGRTVLFTTSLCTHTSFGRTRRTRRGGPTEMRSSENRHVHGSQLVRESHLGSGESGRLRISAWNQASLFLLSW